MLTLICPQCGGKTKSHVECSYGFTRMIYACNNCNWTNRYNQNQTNTSAINTFINGTYVYENCIDKIPVNSKTYIYNSIGGLQHAK